MDWLLEAPGRLLHSVVHRPYTFLLFALFTAVAVLHLGRWRVTWMVVAGYAIAWASERSSISNGFPYGHYEYLQEGLAGDLMVAGVPFFDSLSYTFLVYFGWSAALLLTGRLDARGGLDVRLVGAPEERRGWRVALLAAFLTTWLDVVIDPVAKLGDRWFLGEIYAYRHEGEYFGIPLTNFAGWFLVALAIVRAYQWIDRRGDGRPARGARAVPGQALFGPAGHLAVALFGIVVAAAIGEPRLALASALLQLPVWLWAALRVRGAARAPIGAEVAS